MDEQHKVAIQMLDRIRAYADQPQATAAQQLRVEAQRLIDMFEEQKNAYDLESQAKRIQEMVHAMSDADMSPMDRDDIKDRTQDMQMDLRKFR